jgi:hypothetical protein
MNQKVFIVCLDKSIALDIAKKIVIKDDNYAIAPMFTTDKEFSNEVNENYETYLDVHTVNLSYKNNSLLFIKTAKYISSGITIDDFYNNDICIMDINEYNLIAENIFKKYDIVTIWVDTKNHKNLTDSDLIEINYFYEFISNIDYLYFLDNESNIEDIIIEYIKADEEHRKIILEENS